MPKSEEKLVFDRKLKDFFKTCRYPNRAQKQALAEELKKPVNTISNWFNRHRREDRKERQKAISNNFVINFFQNMHPYPSNSEKSQNKLCQKLRDKILRRKKEKAQNRPTEGKMFTQIFRTYGQIIKIVTGAKRRRAFRQNSKFSKIFIFDQNFDFWQKLNFSRKFWFLTKNSIFDQSFNFWQINKFLTKSAPPCFRKSVKFLSFEKWIFVLLITRILINF